MGFERLDQWLQWQHTLHPRTVDLGLERLHPLVARLGVERPARRVTVVAGTNGKGSSVAFLEAIATATGDRVGAYTSPHLEHFTERIRLNRRPVAEETLCRAFAEVEEARAGGALTPFEFATLGALVVFKAADLDEVFLEVGLGGRLDAVNAVDADAALLTVIGLDHQDYLGDNREAIGREKAGVLRREQWAVCADPNPPQSVLETALAVGARLLRVGHDYAFEALDEQRFRFRFGEKPWVTLPHPALGGGYQLANAAGVLALLAAQPQGWPGSEAVATGLTTAALPGRLEIHAASATLEWVLDVAHNPLGAQALADALTQRPTAATTVVLAALADKDALGMAKALEAVADAWYVAPTAGSRGQTAATLAQALAPLGVDVAIATDMATACGAAAADGAAVGWPRRIVVCGSFQAVAEARRYLGVSRWTES
ncbi:MAG: bifunctional folylpolyglutamate synthase/dihydrofolate synthase [Candidatus Competibacterales bacterium]